MKTEYYSYATGPLCRGCKLCVKGQKLVLFITGLCGEDCFYCPLSDNRRGHDIIWANEMPITPDMFSIKKIVKESKLCDAKGAGITGGDPLLVIDRTVSIIKGLKKHFEDYHIHLYAPLSRVDKNKLHRLHAAGLDEIRFHPSLSDDRYWGRIALAKAYDWKVGIEIPAIPDMKKSTVRLIKSVNVDFININELEISDNNANHLKKLGYMPKDDLSYAIKGSQRMALSLTKLRTDIPFHYCTAKLKDKVQLAERIKRRAKNVAKPWDLITDEGLLLTGVVFPSKEMPLLKLRRMLQAYNVHADRKKDRLLIHPGDLEKIFKDLPLTSAYLEHYPTYDNLETELTILKQT